MPFACLIDSITLCACAISRNRTESNCFLANDLGFNPVSLSHTHTLQLTLCQLKIVENFKITSIYSTYG